MHCVPGAPGWIHWHEWLYARLFGWAQPINTSLLYALACTGLMILPAYALYRRWFIRVWAARQ